MILCEPEIGEAESIPTFRTMHRSKAKVMDARTLFILGLGIIILLLLGFCALPR
jgi:hypothetical protein